MSKSVTNATMEAPAADRLTRVRPATLNDAERLAQLSAELGYPSTREQLEARLSRILASPEHVVAVAETGAAPSLSRAAADGRPADPVRPVLIGWVHAFVERTVESDATAEIGGLVVGESWRGAGAGRLLMEYAERWARGAGCATVTVRSNVIRERAHAFYERLGYKAAKTQRVFRKPLT